jgi:ATP-dependent DNA helicase RecQ
MLAALKRHFGFAGFRPFQEEIIRDALAGKDVFALLPTGGGKSLCFQLPAMLQPGLTVVVSPLIALMKDQVDSMQASGVPATFLNSSLAKGEARERWRRLYDGDYRLLYVAPERLVLEGFLSELPRWKVKLFAIDEAHCISEWGHDFRPEYRELSQLRKLLPDIPIMALTATATTRVRQDIVAQLHLREPNCYVASFNRPNLFYRVEPKSGPAEQVKTFVRDRPRQSGIVYCQARATTEKVARLLAADGIQALPYHAGLSATERAQNQERFIRDQAQVICATIAFGMGINKPNVRWIIHYDLPKSLEGYYQETGRAGRDGLPAECLLLFSAGDIMKYKAFIEEESDPRRQQIARQQLHQMAHYAEMGGCRRAALLDYFGERYPEDTCGACDNCNEPRETFDGTVAAQKLLSCVYRIRAQSRFGVGLNHVAEVLTGANTDKIRRWNHQSLSTYGIGSEHARAEWLGIGRELMRRGLLTQSDGEFPVLELTPEGLAFLKERRTIQLTRAPAKPEPKVVRRIGDISCDEALFDVLRELRRRLADERGVPSYVIFSDVSLRLMARHYPQTDPEFLRINGVGERKLAEYGAAFLAEIAAFLQSHPRQMFAEDVEVARPAPAAKPGLTLTVSETLGRIRAGQTVRRVAQERFLAESTIWGHLIDALKAGEKLDLHRLFTPEQQTAMAQALKLHSGDFHAMLDHLGPDYNSGMIRVFRELRKARAH